jgi:transposase
MAGRDQSGSRLRSNGTLPVHSITLNADERAALLKVYRSGCGRRARQAHVLLLLDDGVSYQQIRRMAYVSFTLIADCVRRFRDARLSGFPKDVARIWKPKRLSDEELRSLEQLLSQGATSHGWANQWWTAKRVSELIDRHFGKKYSPESARRILKCALAGRRSAQ